MSEIKGCDVRLICTDLDGTLLDGEGGISCENLRAIGEIAERGCIFVPTTGRALSEVPEELTSHPSVRYIISSNGARITDLSTGEHICRSIPPRIAGAAFRYMLEGDALFANHQRGVTYADPDKLSAEAMEHYRLNGYYSEYMHRVAVLEDHDRVFSADPEEIDMLAGFFSSDEGMARSLSLVSRLEGIAITRSTQGMFEVISSEAGKGAAVLRLAERLGIAQSDILTAGDGANDVSMFSVSRYSVASFRVWDETVRSAATHTQPRDCPHLAEYILQTFFRDNR